MLDNQQERLEFSNWIVGFTDGEGCFTVSIFKNSTTKLGWQIFPEFVITQSEQDKKLLHLIKEFFKCGIIKLNRRQDNHKFNLYQYSVRNIEDLRKIIIPFFKQNSLRTKKRKDFLIFSRIVRRISKKKHLNKKGFKTIADLASKMNRQKKRKF